MLQMSKNRKTKRICFMGLLFATAVVLSYIEGMVSVPGLPPGVKLGLSNIAVSYTHLDVYKRQVRCRAFYGWMPSI